MKRLVGFLAIVALILGLGFVFVFRPVEVPSIPTIAPEVVTNSTGNPVEGTHWNIEELDYVMRWIPAGSFVMGSPSFEEHRNPDEDQHAVTLSDGFWLGQFEVRHKDWKHFVEQDGYKSEAELKTEGYGTWVFDEAKKEILQAQDKNWMNVHAHGDNHPVMAISYNDAMAFCQWLTDKERTHHRLSETQQYTLPTEAQWEYACRGPGPGKETVFHFGNKMTGLEANFNGQFPYGDNKPGLFQQSTIPVGSYMPNGYGLYDMHGNTFEWCLDWYVPYPKPKPETESTDFVVVNPTGPVEGDKRCYRGGSWFDLSQYCRSAFRGKTPPSDRSDHLGFRLALIDVPNIDSQ